MPMAEDATGPATPQVQRLQDRLLGWYEACRRDLPWRRTRDPYAIWVSEIMLQQTRVETVIPYYERFLSRFPDVLSLAEAKPDDVLAAWSGLGYYRRARLLHEGAKSVAASGGEVPSNREGLLDVPGIGRYTAGAVASIAFGEPVGLVDGNVARVLARLFALTDDMRKPAGQRRAERVADAIVARSDPGAWNQALMELGATVCTPRAPKCEACPVAESCRARAEGRAEALPVMSAKAEPTLQRVQSLVAIDGDRVLLARRTHERTFGGLWEPPSADGPAKAKAALAALFPLGRVRKVGRVEHVLSHRRLVVDVHRAELTARATAIPAGYDAVRLASRADLATVGIATLARKVLGTAGVLEA
jgi:A/G-specific adenine glycosylase